MTSTTERPAPTALHRTDEAVRDHGRHGRTWLDAMWRADPLADAVVTDPSAARDVRRLMTEGTAAVSDPSPAVAALLRHVESEPAWLDRDALDRAADVLVRYTAQWGGLVLGAASLLRGADNHVAALPLLLTGRYGAEPARRSIEVGAWLAQVVRPDQYSRDFCRALTEDYLAPQLATMLIGPDRFRQDLARRAMYGMSRVFLGDEAADSLGVPDGAAKHVVRAARPLLLGLDQARLHVLGRERATARGYVARDRELARLRAEEGMTHDLVDSVPGAVGSS